MKKWGLAIIGIILAGMTVCGVLGKYEKTKAEDHENVQITVSFCNIKNPRTTAIWKDVLENLDLAHFTVEWRDADSDMEKQQTDIRELMEYSPEYLVVMPVKTIGLEEELRKVSETDTRIILLDRSIAGSNEIPILAEIRTDQHWEGEVCANLLNQYFAGREGQILELRGESGSSISREHSTGFRNQLREYENLEIKGSIEGNGDRGIARNNVMNYLLNSPGSIDAIFADTDEDGIGAVSALEELGLRGQIPVVSINGIKDIKTAIQAGGYLGTIEAVPYMGKILSELIQKDMQGTEISYENILHGSIFTKENLDEMQGY
ncbi:hypothetical protein GCM10008910_46760 [Faecalicatena orotica]|uniref:ABC-type sugar transport system substrate-binding protein n=1 Tax=Faecalicatena orotica TaxID=1544 RepID=A0A2Y9BJE1_9FIRM|nr:substrate-binding domain-containing protein [Faecalicatena orotica]PWJ29382.1 ABC-type sugar transport system substrate-binding protein [Faecalicatena orotica]SSA55837.1 ABC-type sugar transport system, substrate-binding protein, contains N-terminal xre family HTH domain [Faecalicatena orotica]